MFPVFPDLFQLGMVISRFHHSFSSSSSGITKVPPDFRISLVAYENTSYVNELFEEHGIENVRVLTPEEARVWLANYAGDRNISKLLR